MKTLVRLSALLALTACIRTTPPCAGPTAAGDCVLVTIPRRATFAVALDSLESAGVIRTRWAFAIYGRIRGLRSDLKSGTYRLPRNADWGDVVHVLRSGRGIEARFTVPEGMMLTEVADVAARQLRIPKDSFLAAARAPAALAALGLNGTATSVEGYLFPTTYVVPVGLTARELVDIMTSEFRAQWSANLGWSARLGELGMSRHQLVTLASIVEAEVRYAPDGEYVSAVYHNRLRVGMALQADPTVIYAHGRRLPRVWERHLRIRSPYNTYIHTGLPPGPIGQPGRASLEAALYPKDAPYLFFVAQRDGKHVFSTTYRQHLDAIRNARQRPRPTSARAPSPPARRSRGAP